MKSTAAVSLIAALAAATALTTAAHAQPASGTVESHIAAGKAAAGRDHTELFDSLCKPASGPAPAITGERVAPERSTWHYEPVKVFDNLFYVGEKEYSAWAITTSQGIIVVDTIWSHSVEDEIVGGLKKLGLDPANIKYAIVSHAHIDHIGGAKYLQEKFGTRIVMSAADWEFAEKSTRLPAEIKPKRDMVVADGEKLTLGDTTIEFHFTPGHTPGTLSLIYPVKDGGTQHRVETYINSAVRYHGVVAKSGADILLSNHTRLDGSATKLPAAAKRKPGEPNPFVVGNDSVQRYVKVAEECARANLLMMK
jgi:metallo-beta-lactamase class B